MHYSSVHPTAISLFDEFSGLDLATNLQTHCESSSTSRNAGLLVSEEMVFSSSCMSVCTCWEISIMSTLF